MGLKAELAEPRTLVWKGRCMKALDTSAIEITRGPMGDTSGRRKCPPFDPGYGKPRVQGIQGPGIQHIKQEYEYLKKGHRIARPVPMSIEEKTSHRIIQSTFKISV